MNFIEQDRRWGLIRRLINDDQLDASTRVIALLLLLHAQPLTRISRLKLDDITVEDGIAIAFGPVPTVLPPPLDGLISELLR